MRTRYIRQLTAYCAAIICMALAGCGDAPPNTGSGQEMLIGKSFYAGQADGYRESAGSGSLIIILDNSGKELAREKLNAGSAAAVGMTPDSKRVLCKKDIVSAGEYYSCGYMVYNLEDKSIHELDGEQQGFAGHVILDDNMLGYAFGDQIKLYDMRYAPLDVGLSHEDAFAQDGASSRVEPFATAIGYDGGTGEFFIVWALDPGSDGQYEGSRIGVTVHGADGALLRSKILDAQYTAPYSGNLRTLYPGIAKALPGGLLLIEVQSQAGARTLALVDTKSWAVKEYPCRSSDGFGGARVSANGRYIFAYGDANSSEHGESALILEIEGADIKTAAEILVPAELDIDGASYSLYPIDAVLTERGEAYLMLEMQGEGVFELALAHYADGATELIGQLPLDAATLAGVDGEGGCVILISGGVE